MRKLSSKLMGYNKKQVDEYLEKVLRIQNEEKTSIKESIENYRMERDDLVQELDLLREEKEKYAGSRELLEFAFQRTKSVIDAIDELAREDIESIDREKKQRLSDHENFLAEIKNEIKKIRMQMDLNINKIFHIVGGKESPGRSGEELAAGKVVGTIFHSTGKSGSIVSVLGSGSGANEGIAGKTVVTSNGVPVGRVGNLAFKEPTKEIEGFYLTDEQAYGGKFVRAEWILAVKKNSLVISADWQKLSLLSGEAESSEASGDAIPEHPDNSAGLTDVAGLVASAMAPENPENHGHGLKKEAVADAGGYWDSADDFTHGAEVHLDIAESSHDSNVKENTLFSPVQEAKEQNEKTMPPADNLKASPAVAKEIKAIRHKYIVGKLAGNDLLDNSGQIIIHKNGLISPEVVELAEKEGKLPELIINMVIPGLEV